MSRPLPTTFLPAPVSPLSGGHLIKEGSASGYIGELDLVENLHWAWAYLRSPVVSTVFSQDAGAGAGEQPYLVGQPSGSPLVRAMWVVPVVGRWLTWSISALVENTSGSDAATLRFDLESDPHPGTYVDITVGVSTAAWTEVTAILACPSGVDYDTIRCLPLNGATGELRVHSITIAPTARTSVPGTSHTFDGVTWVPCDTIEADGSSPLSVALRNKQLAGVEYVRRTLIDVPVGWSDNALYRTELYKDTVGSYVQVLRLPFRTRNHHSALRWGLYGFARGATPRVSLQTATMKARGTAAVEVTIASGWTADFSANRVTYDDGSMVALDVTPSADEELLVSIKYCSLMSLTAWLV